MANWAWVRTHDWSGVAIDDLPHLQRWVQAIADRPAAQRGVQIPPRAESAEDLVKAGQTIVVR
jgi:glutathione S-transferase/GST-like protein